MTIDIITYTDAQLAVLSEEQILQIKSAQLKKNRLAAALSEDLKKAKHRLVKNGTFLSDAWKQKKQALETSYQQEVENIREGLLFYLRFAAKPEDTGTSSAPYTVDYSLTDAERLDVVRTYYMNTYTNASERVNAFKKDQVARVYLGELYAPLYDYFLDLV